MLPDERNRFAGLQIVETHGTVQGSGHKSIVGYKAHNCDLRVGQIDPLSATENRESHSMPDAGVNAGEKVWRVAERKCGTVTRLMPAEWRVSIPP